MYTVIGNRLDHIVKCGNSDRPQKIFIKRDKNWLQNKFASPHKEIIYHRGNTQLITNHAGLQVYTACCQGMQHI